MRLPASRNSFLSSGLALSLLTAGACEVDSAYPSVAQGGSGGGGAASQGGSSVLPGGAGGAIAGTTSQAGTPAAVGGGGAGTGGAGSGGGGAGGSSGSGGSAGSAGAGGAGGGKMPMCMTPDVEDGVDRAKNNYIECDVEAQAIDFDVMAAYDPERDPGYDPVTTPISFTSYGTAFTGSAVQECHPYCYKGNATLGLDFVAGGEPSLRGEVLFAFPNTEAPIANANGRNSLGWVFLDGPALPAGTKVTVQMVLKSMDKAETALGTGTHDLPLKTWVEFKYFPIQQGFQAADLVNVTHIGFRVTMTPANAAQNWSGVIYADHFQLRQ